MRIASLFQSRRQQPNQAKRPAPRTWRPRVEWLEERLPLAINVEFDFSCDASGFFNEPARREVLQEAANEIVGRLNDTLAELPANSGGFTWTAVFDNPGPGNLACSGNVVKKSFSLPANTLKIFVAGRTFDTPGPSLARPKLGITETQGDAAWDARVKGRLEPGATASPATDFGPWGGSISFDVTASSKSWFIGLLEKSPIRPLLPDEYDFFSVAQRAIGSLLGFGTTDSWNRFLTDSAFTGSKATEIFGAPVPVTKVATGTFWKDGTLFDGKPVSMDLVFNAGQRVHFTNLDLAALHDLGWEVTYAPNAPAPSQDNSRIAVTGIDGLKKFNPPNDFTERHIHEASFNGLIYRAGIDDDDGLWVDVSGDGGQTFRDRNDFGGGEEAIFTPSLTVHGDRLFMAWPGTDSDHLV
ncbi:MAG TPA: hypothetical protein VFB80_05675, partial [Pirellulaceae bacterium]|nr:hypothetical protein [Pirellulaceae bacterium]